MPTIKIYWRDRPEDDVPDSAGYAFKPLSFVYSIVGHCILAAILLLVPFPSQDDIANLRYDLKKIEKIRDRQIIYYQVENKLPKIAPTQQEGKSDAPQARIFNAEQTLIVMPKKADPGRQFVWQPLPEVKMKSEIKAPNMVEIAVPATPLPKPTPKVYVPPPKPVTGNAAIPLATALPDVASVTKAPDQIKLPVPVNQVRVAKPTPKPFIPPARSGPAGAKPDPRQVFEEAPPEARPAAAGTSGRLNLAILGMDPSKQLESAISQGSRPAVFSQGPVVGAPSTGKGDASVPLKLPGVMAAPGVKNNAASTPGAPTMPAGRSRELVLEIHLPPTAGTISAPLRPSARSIPRTLEQRFANRVVYTMVVSPPQMPMYTGNWVIWYAEREQRPGPAPLMRPPIPVRKYQIGSPLPGTPTEAWVQVGGIVDRKGSVSMLTILNQDAKRVEQAAVLDLSGWEFRPATRNGEPVDVEVVIEVPLRLPGTAK